MAADGDQVVQNASHIRFTKSGEISEDEGDGGGKGEVGKECSAD